MTRYRCYYRSILGMLSKPGDKIVLGKEESHHLLSVLRVRPKEKVSVFDGQGNEWDCEFEAKNNNCAQLVVVKHTLIQRPKQQLVLLQAIPKGKVMDQIIKQATEIGVNKIIPLKTQRTELKLDESRSQTRLDRWNQAAIEACKQSNNPFVPEITPIQSYKDAIALLDPKSLKFIASLEPNSKYLGEYIKEKQYTQLAWLIGPEGDFSPEEYKLAQVVQFQPVRLSRNILRSETAALYALSVLDYMLR